jgi:hypothetical protein
MKWNYSSGTTNLLPYFASSSTHQEYLDFWYTDLIDKIMNSMVVETDMAGNYGIILRLGNYRDWAKFGLLYLHKGYWNNKYLMKAG